MFSRALEGPEYLPFTRAMRHCARGIAYAAKLDVAKARAEQKAFLAAQQLVAKEGIVGNNTAADVLGVAECLLAGEIDVRDGKVDGGSSSFGRRCGGGSAAVLRAA